MINTFKLIKINYKLILKKLTIIFSLLLISITPWLEFFNANIKEKDFLFNNNSIILILLYLILIITIFCIIRIFLIRDNEKVTAIILFSLWIFFKHNFLKEIIASYNINIYFSQFSSEISLLLIIILILIAIVFLKKKIFRIFIIIFSYLIFFYTSFIFIVNLNNHVFDDLYKNHNNFPKTEYKNIDNTKNLNLSEKPNIYFFIIDAMKPLNEFIEFYNNDLQNFKSFYTKENFLYNNNTKNYYDDTASILTSMFLLEDQNYVKKKNDLKKFTSNSYVSFPSILKADRKLPPLLFELKNLGYKFKWIGNLYADCSRFNYGYCLNNKKENYIDIYLLSAFLQKTPLLQIYNILSDLDLVRKYINFDNKMDSIDKFNEFLIQNNNYPKINQPNFYFIHDLQTHWPYLVNENCNYKRYEGKKNYEGYYNAYLCSINKIMKIIKTINLFDASSIVVFQSDHNWEMSLDSTDMYGDRKSIFNLFKIGIKCKNEIPKNPNNINLTKHILNCIS